MTPRSSLALRSSGSQHQVGFLAFAAGELSLVEEPDVGKGPVGVNGRLPEIGIAAGVRMPRRGQSGSGTSKSTLSKSSWIHRLQLLKNHSISVHFCVCNPGKESRERVSPEFLSQALS